jgi:hypothetical protein
MARDVAACVDLDLLIARLVPRLDKPLGGFHPQAGLDTSSVFWELIRALSC